MKTMPVLKTKTAITGKQEPEAQTTQDDSDAHQRLQVGFCLDSDSGLLSLADGHCTLPAALSHEVRVGLHDIEHASGTRGRIPCGWGRCHSAEVRSGQVGHGQVRYITRPFKLEI
jgi:hypothetical protein